MVCQLLLFNKKVFVVGGFFVLGVEQEMQYVVVFDGIGFVFDVEFVGFVCVGFVFIGDVIVIGDGFGVDEVVFEIVVDYVCGLWCQCVFVDGSGVGFFWVYGEIGFQFQKVIVCVDQVIQIGFGQIYFIQKYLGFVGGKLVDFFFDFG